MWETFTAHQQGGNCFFFFSFFNHHSSEQTAEKVEQTAAPPAAVSRTQTGVYSSHQEQQWLIIRKLVLPADCWTEFVQKQLWTVVFISLY